MLLLGLMVAGCGPADPTATSPPPANTEVAMVPTATPVPPTATPALPTATATPVPPSATPVLPTATPTAQPTDTPEPTNTPRPTRAPTSTPEGYEALWLKTSDGLQLAASLYRPVGSAERPLAVVLAHEAGASQRAWESFAQLLAGRGFTALTLDHRGCGQSEGIEGFSSVSLDIKAAVQALQARGFERIACVGASMGGTACMIAAVDTELEGVAMLSSPPDLPGAKRVSSSELAAMGFPKLFIVAEEDRAELQNPGFVAEILKLAHAAPEPKELVVYPGSSHATELLWDENGEDVQSKLVEFLEGLAPQDAGSPAPVVAGPPQWAAQTWMRPADNGMTVFVPGGTFQMGTGVVAQSEGYPEEFPAHAVTLDDYWIDQYEVTNRQFAIFLNARGNQEEDGVAWLQIDSEFCLLEQVGDEYQPKRGYADYPAIDVSWYGARAFCQWAGGRLPTEAEWEYATRGPEASIYAWGDEFDCSHGNFDDETAVTLYVVPGGEGCDGYLTTAPVGTFPSGASWCGALDMAGNASEWVADWYSDFYPSSPQKNPTGPEKGSGRVVRGGSWISPQRHVRGATRFHYRPINQSYYIGFRCVQAATAPSGQ